MWPCTTVRKTPQKEITTYLATAWRTATMGSVKESSFTFANISSRPKTCFHNALLSGSLHWVRTVANSLKAWTTSVRSFEANDAATRVITSSVTWSESVLTAQQCGASPLALLLNTAAGVMEFKTCAKIWLDKEVMNRPLSFCSWRTSLMNPVRETE